LAQAFAVVEQLDKGLCVEGVGRLSFVMATTSSSPKATVAGPIKAQGTSKSSRQVAMVAEVKKIVNLRMRCWNCRLLGHDKRNCLSNKSFDGKSGSQPSSGGCKANVTNKSHRAKAQRGHNGKYTTKVHSCTLWMDWAYDGSALDQKSTLEASIICTSGYTG
jgi:hypothetical protein